MTTDESKALRALCEAATPGPWAEAVWYGTNEGGWAAIGPHHAGADDECDDDASDNHARAEHDAAFIAAARTALPALLDELARTRAQIDEARERLAQATEFNSGDGRIIMVSADGDGTWWVANPVERTPIGIGDRWNCPTAEAAFAALAAARKEPTK
jgi:hypothetical protein